MYRKITRAEAKITYNSGGLIFLSTSKEFNQKGFSVTRTQKTFEVIEDQFKKESQTNSIDYFL